MPRLTFERTITFTLILIFLLSTFSLYNQYINIEGNENEKKHMKTINITGSLNLTMQMVASDKKYAEGKYKEAMDEYLKIIINNGANLNQKATAYFKIGMCNYMLKDYEIARISFLDSLEFDPDNSNAYNNAAVCSHMLNKRDEAISLIKKAVDILPAVEYYYNLAKIYENIGSYDEMIRYLNIVQMGEPNSTFVDPVIIKNKLESIKSKNSYKVESIEDIVIALRLKDPSNFLMMNDIDMDILSTDFETRIANTNTANKRFLTCSYNTKINDPYNLINNVKWTIRTKSGRSYNFKGKSLNTTIETNNLYSVTLYISYKGSLIKERTKQISIRGDDIYKETAKIETNQDIERVEKVEQKCKSYDYAIYEQVFDNDFKLSTKPYYDRFNVSWTKDNIETKLMDVDIPIDSGYSLFINNNTNKNAGIRVNLSSILKDKNLKGKKIVIYLWARKITEYATMNMTLRSTGKTQVYRNYDLDMKWKQFRTDPFEIPTQADKLTLSINLKPNQQIKIDGFYIIIAD